MTTSNLLAPELMSTLQARAEALKQSAGTRMWLTASHVSIEAARIETQAMLPSFEAQHFLSLRLALGQPVAIIDGVWATAYDDVIVLEYVDNNLDVLRVAHECGLGVLAGDVLDVSLALGRNILMCGPQRLCQRLVTALAAQGQRPGRLADKSLGAVPSTWLRPCSVSAAQALGVDRLAIWGEPNVSVVRAMGRFDGVAAHLMSTSAKRALMRFEAASPGDSTALAVLAAVDLVVCVGMDAQIFEVVLAADGYRLSPVFASDPTVMPNVAVPVGLPTFVDEFIRLQRGDVVEALTSAIGHNGRTYARDVQRRDHAPTADLAPRVPSKTESLQRSSTRPAHAPSHEFAARLHLAQKARLATGTPKALGTPASTVRPLDSGLPLSEPGWELDQNEGMSDAKGDVAFEADPAAAEMAAAYGLEPPPRPKAGVHTTFDGEPAARTLARVAAGPKPARDEHRDDASPSPLMGPDTPEDEAP